MIDGWLGSTKPTFPKWSCLPSSPSLLSLFSPHSTLHPRVTEKANAHVSSICTIATTRDRERGRQEEVINYQEVLARQRRTCTPALLGLTHTHTHIRSWGNQALRLQPAEDCSRAGQRRSAVSVAAYLPAPGPPLSHPAPDAMIFSLTSCSGCMRKFSHFQSYRLCFGWKQAGQLMSQVQQTFGLSYLKAG